MGIEKKKESYKKPELKEIEIEDRNGFREKRSKKSEKRKENC